jgi:hypothetical protein
MIIKAHDNGRRSFPSYGQYTYPVGTKLLFGKLEIKQIKIPTQIRPDGSRSPMAEAVILGRYKAILQNRASSNGDIMSPAWGI